MQLSLCTLALLKCRALGIETTDKWYAHTHPTQCVNTKVFQCYGIEGYTQTTRNVAQKVAEKKLKYKSLCVETKQMWNMKCMIVPVIIGAIGRVTECLKKNSEAIQGKHSIDALQKTSWTRNITHNTVSNAV